MTSHLLILGLLVSACASTSTPTGPTISAPPQTLGAPVSIPIVVHGTADGGLRPIVDVSVAGGKPVPVLLDTGSTGLDILASAAGSDRLTRLSQIGPQAYVDGTRYERTLAEAPVAFGPTGSVRTGAPIEVALIDSVDCVPTQPNCPGRSGADGLIGRGLYGTLGVSLTPSNRSDAADISSPLLQIPGGGSAFRVGFSSQTTGSITVGSATGSAGETTVIPLAPATPSRSSGQVNRGWNVASAVVCWTIGSASPRCGPTTFDTGSPTPALDASGFPATFLSSDGRTFAPGLRVSVSAPGQPAFWTFVTGSAPDGTLFTRSPSPTLIATTGSAFYLAGSVTYDAVDGRLLITGRP